MHFRRFLRFIFVVVLLFGMFGLCSSTIYQSGFSQGVAAGQAADGPAVDSAPGPSFAGPRAFFGSIFGFFWWAITAFFKFWLFVFFIGLVFKVLFGGRKWHHHGRHGKWGDHHGWHQWKHNSDWKHKGWHGQDGKGWDFKGQRPPWFDDSDGEPVMKA